MFEGTALGKSWANVANNNSASRKKRRSGSKRKTGKRSASKTRRNSAEKVTGRNSRNIELAKQDRLNLAIHEIRAKLRSQNRSPPKRSNSPLSRMEKRQQAAAKRRATRSRSPPKEGNSPLSRMEKRLQRLRAARS
jgi:hypothetical protein